MTATAGAERWESLGALLIQRRTALNPAYHNRRAFSKATGLNYRGIYDIEEHRRTNYGRSTLAAFEVAYQLPPGAITRYLAGEEIELPAPAGDPRREERTGAAPHLALVPEAGGDPWDDAEGFEVAPDMQQAMAPHLRTAENAVRTAARNHPGQPLTGRLVFPFSTADAGLWDMLAALTGSVKQVMQMYAATLARADQRAQRPSGTGIGLTPRPGAIAGH